MREKTPKESEVIMREMVMPGDTNAHGTIFGGKVLSWIDIAGAMCASLHSNTQVVTVHMDDIEFKSPINIGCHVVIKSSINYVGKSSMVVGVKVMSENPLTGITRTTTKAYLTFVALDEFGKPTEVPRLNPETDNEKRRYKNAQERLKSRKELSLKIQED
ncbi:MAG: acyl-CoA thioesterase [Bdellovibrionota bacterium]|nr:acyl-CoA thioesterase [Bdellovibrionota bacterium]